MEDKDCVPDVSKSSLNKANRISVISIILIAVISIIIILSIAKILTHKDKLDISKQVFMLSDKSMIYFVDNTNSSYANAPIGIAFYAIGRWK